MNGYGKSEKGELERQEKKCIRQANSTDFCFVTHLFFKSIHQFCTEEFKGSLKHRRALHRPPGSFCLLGHWPTWYSNLSSLRSSTCFLQCHHFKVIPFMWYSLLQQLKPQLWHPCFFPQSEATKVSYSCPCFFLSLTKHPFTCPMPHWPSPWCNWALDQMSKATLLPGPTQRQYEQSTSHSWIMQRGFTSEVTGGAQGWEALCKPSQDQQDLQNWSKLHWPLQGNVMSFKKNTLAQISCLTLRVLGPRLP